MKSLLLTILPALFFALLTVSNAEETTRPTSGEPEKKEENSQVGPEKGILSASEHEGFKLNAEAEAKFEVLRVRIPKLPFSIDSKWVVRSLEEQNLYRYRNGFYKRVDFKTINKTGSTLTVQSKDLMVGDELVTQGLGYLRIAEIAAFGGTPDEH